MHCWKSTRDNEGQPVSCTFLTAVPQPYTVDFLPVIKNGFSMTLPSVQNIGCHQVFRLVSHTVKNFHCTHERLSFVSVVLVVECFTISYYKKAKWSLRACALRNCNVCNRHCSHCSHCNRRG